MLTNYHDKKFITVCLFPKVKFYNSRMIPEFYMKVFVIRKSADPNCMHFLYYCDLKMVLCLNQRQCRNSFSHDYVPLIEYSIL